MPASRIMTATRWSAVERIFHAALDRPAAERLTFVAGACGGDADLLREVHSLLDQTSRPGFLDEPAIHGRFVERQRTYSPSTRRV